MTVNVQTTEWTMVPNGVTNTLNFDNLVLSANDIVIKGWDTAGVERNDLLPSISSITGIANPAGGLITWTTPPPITLALVKAFRDTTRLQQSNLSDFVSRPATAEMADWDRGIASLQEVNTRLGRALRVPTREPSVAELPRKATRSGALLGFNGTTGDPEAVAYGTVGGVLPFADPTGTIGLAPVNGVAPTALRSDAAPALSQAIAPTWTGQHAFNLNPTVPTPAKTDSTQKAVPAGWIKVRETWVNAYDDVLDPVSSNWTAYMDAAVARLPSGGGCVKWPVGNVPMATGLAAISNKNVRIDGFGDEVSKILFTHAVQEPFTFNHAASAWATEVNDLTIIAQGVNNPNSAIRITYPTWVPGAEEHSVGAKIKNVSVYGANQNNDQFSFGMQLTNAFRALVDNCKINGKKLTTNAILIYLAGSGSKEVTVRRCRQVCGNALVFTDIGVSVIEGLLIDDCDVVATNLLASLNVANGPDFKIINNHAQCFIGGVWAQGIAQFFARGNTFYKRDSAPGEPAAAQYKVFQLQSCGDVDIAHNFAYVIDPTDRTDDVFVDAVSSHGAIKDNRFTDFDVGVNLATNSNMVVEENRYSSVGAFAQNVPAAATVRNNYSLTSDIVVQLAANAATPSLAPTYASMFRTNNSIATIITDFLGGFNGQVFELLVNDANTTIKHNATIISKGFVDATPPNGAMLRYRRDGNVWRETSRSY